MPHIPGGALLKGLRNRFMRGDPDNLIRVMPAEGRSVRQMFATRPLEHREVLP